VLGGALDLSHVAWHFHAAHDGSGEKALADGAGAAMPPFGAVGRVAAAEMMALDYALEAPSFGNADGVHIITRGKERGSDDVTRFDFFGKVAKFPDAFE